MHAAVQHSFGPPSALRFEAVPDPVPGPGQVRIAVAAAGVHLIDTALRSGVSDGPFAAPVLPFVGGREVAGVVDALGPGVDPSWHGRSVAAHLGPLSGGYASLALAPLDALHALPDGVDPALAVAMVGTGRTAFGILEWAALTPDDVVLVTSAAGGLGVLLVQAALDAGCIVVGASGGPSKVSRVRSLGAAVAVDYDDPAWPAAVRSALGDRGVTVVLDAIGGERGRAALELLVPGGRLLVYGWSSGSPTRLDVFDLVRFGITASAAIGARMSARPGGLRGLQSAALEALVAGRIVPLLTRFPLAEAAAAHAALESRATVGKVVLIP